MQAKSLSVIARDQLDAARKAPAGRAASTVSGGHERVMRQTVIALTEGSVLHEHENPGEATLYILTGRVEIKSEDDAWTVSAGELIDIPPSRHAVHALQDSVVLLTAVPLSHNASR